MRALFAVSGLAALAWGGWLVWDFTTQSTSDSVQALAWFVGGPILHDGLVAPVVGVTGLVIARRLPSRWRAPVAVGLVVSAVLAVLAIPLLWRPFGVPNNPGLHDGNYGLRLGVALGGCWLVVLLVVFAAKLRRAARGRARG